MKNTKLIIYAILAVIAIIGAIGAVNIFINGEHAMGTSDRVPWGILISGYVLLAVFCSGLCFMSSLSSVFGLKQFEVVTKRAILFAVTTLMCGFYVLVFELGNPFNLIYIALSPNLHSLMFWMGLLYGIYTVILILELFNILRNSHKWAHMFGIAAFFAAVAANSNLGALFGGIIARPFWTGPFSAIYILATAFMSGAAILAIMFYFVEKQGKVASYKGKPIMPAIGRTLSIAIFAVAVMTVWRVVSGMYGGMPGNYDAMMGLLTGPLALNFWIFEIGLAIVLPLIILYLPGGMSSQRIMMAGSSTVVGIFMMRFDFVVAGQIAPLNVVPGVTETIYHSYNPSWSEWSLLFGGIALAILVYMIAEDKLDLDYKEEANHGEESISAKASVEA
jgi:molybdopterin-containing oxidoreductase family membrane subunit